MEWFWVALIVLPFGVAAWMLTAVAWLVYAAVGIWLAICLLWAPFAGLLLVRASPDRLDSLSAKARRFLLGAAMSALFLLPWVYLIRCYRGKPLLRFPPVRKAHNNLYLVWAAGTLQQALVYPVAATAIYLFESYRGSHPLFLGVLIPLAATLLHVGTFIWSRRSLSRRLDEDWRNAATDESGVPVTDFRTKEYLWPFVLAYVWTVFGILHHLDVLYDLLGVFPGFPGLLDWYGVSEW